MTLKAIDTNITSAKACIDEHGSFASFDKNKKKCIVVLNKGYNSHGRWSTLGKIRVEELDRDNLDIISSIDSSSLPKNTKAIWVDSSRRGALRYLLNAEEWDRLLSPDKPLTPEEKEMSEDLFEIPLKASDVMVVNGGKYVGYLIARFDGEKVI